jgi:hypothetical protein
MDRMSPPPSRRTVGAAWASAAAAILGFLPLHLAWALGIPLFANEELFRPWHADGGGAYLWVLNALILLPALLALALVRPWGLTFAGRRIPRLLLIVPGYAVTLALGAYTAAAPIILALQWNSPAAIFSAGTVIFGIGVFAVLVSGLAVATRSYARRTRS